MRKRRNPPSHLRTAWYNICRRVRGQILDGAGVARWAGLPVEWANFKEFETWALANGYVEGLSPDRKREAEGYTADNVQWITFEANKAKARNAHRAACRCFWCKGKRVKLHAPRSV